MVRPLIYDKGFNNNIIGDVDTIVKNQIISLLNNDHVFVNTTWIENDLDLQSIISKEKITVCYSGPDWENTNCIDIRRQAHQYIKENSKEVIHIGNTRGDFYFNFWAEFIRLNSTGFFDNRYLTTPCFEKVYMNLNRKPHDHRSFLVDQMKSKSLIEKGLVSFGDQITLNETLDKLVDIGEQAVYGHMSIKNDIVTLGDADNWSKCFINVVSETTVHTDVFISEKTWKPIIGLRPFLILGDNNIYPQLKELGFDTFDDIFGTWWQDNNWQHRATRIVDILNDFDLKDCQHCHSSIYDRLLKNRERFLAYIKENQKRIGTIL